MGVIGTLTYSCRFFWGEGHLFRLQVSECKVIQKIINAVLVLLFADYQQRQQPMTNQSLLSSIACFPCFVSNANRINQLLL